MSYYPYGEERTSTADDREKFGTYTRDSSTQDYADQRYYAVGMGRFNTPDPSTGVNPFDPTSWNRYLYVGGDPINFRDRAGTCRTGADDENGDADPDDPCQSGPGQRKGKEQPRKPVEKPGHGGKGPSFDSIYKAEGELTVLGLHTPCQDALSDLGVSISGLADQSLQTRYVDATRYDSNDPTLTQHLFFGNGNFTNINAAGSGDAYVPTARDNSQLPDVVLRAQFFLDLSNDPYKAQVTLVHELLHIYLKKDDDQLASFLGINDSQSSPAITEWLDHDCAKTVK